MERRSAASGPCVLARQKDVRDELGQKPDTSFCSSSPTRLVLAFDDQSSDSERLLQ